MPIIYCGPIAYHLNPLSKTKIEESTEKEISYIGDWDWRLGIGILDWELILGAGDLNQE